MKKPPLGLMPKKIWEKIRINELLAAMRRYSEVNKPIPIEWISELEEYLEKY